MSFTIFYAWQSDRPSRGTRSLIQQAAQQAMRVLHAAGEVEEAPRLDHDTKDVPGTPDIAETIFRKIDDCGIFLADLTFVGRTDEGGKLLPNANVMVELGHATSSIGWERIILVMNTAFGSPEALPFDLRHRRHPISYRLGAEDSGPAQVRDDLAQKLAVAIRAILNSGALDARPSELHAQGASEARAKRAAFESSIKQNLFHGMRPDHGILALSLVAHNPPTMAPDLAAIAKAHAADLATLDNDGDRIAHRGKSIFRASRYEQGNVPHAVTELTQDGAIFAVHDDYLVRLKDGDRHASVSIPAGAKGFVPSVAFERDLTEAAERYLRVLAAVGVNGHVDVGISLLRVHGYVMGVGHARSRRGEGRVFDGDEMVVDAVSVQLGMKTPLTTGSLARALRPAFDFIWREFGYSGSPRQPQD